MYHEAVMQSTCFRFHGSLHVSNGASVVQEEQQQHKKDSHRDHVGLEK